MGFSSTVKIDAMVACGRHCSICHKFCGIKMEVHHIETKGDGGDDTFDNAIPLCFDCHSDMSSYDHKHPKGIKYTIDELRAHRDNWYDKVKGNIGLANKADVTETDKKVYLALIKIIPWDGTIKFLRENNFAGYSFDTAKLDNLDEFMWKMKNPAFEFVDPDLEGLRVDFVQKTINAISLINRNTFPTNHLGYNSVPEEWEIEQPEKFDQVVGEIHNANGQLCESYDLLVRTATRKLGVLPEDFA